jgi:hypothetical protein
MLVCVKSLGLCKGIHSITGCLRSHINVVYYERKLSLNNHFGANVNDTIQFVEIFIF